MTKKKALGHVKPKRKKPIRSKPSPDFFAEQERADRLSSIIAAFQTEGGDIEHSDAQYLIELLQDAGVKGSDGYRLYNVTLSTITNYEHHVRATSEKNARQAVTHFLNHKWEDLYAVSTDIDSLTFKEVPEGEEHGTLLDYCDGDEVVY